MTGNKQLGPRARVLGLEWKEPKPKPARKKRRVKSKPKKQKITTNAHDPRTKSQAYPNVTDGKAITVPHAANALEHIELDKQLTPDVIYLDDE